MKRDRIPDFSVMVRQMEEDGIAGCDTAVFRHDIPGELRTFARTRLFVHLVRAGTMATVVALGGAGALAGLWFL